jgi:hypothetical protein
MSDNHRTFVLSGMMPLSFTKAINNNMHVPEELLNPELSLKEEAAKRGVLLSMHSVTLDDLGFSAPILAWIRIDSNCNGHIPEEIPKDEVFWVRIGTDAIYQCSGMGSTYTLVPARAVLKEVVSIEI